MFSAVEGYFPFIDHFISCLQFSKRWNSKEKAVDKKQNSSVNCSSRIFRSERYVTLINIIIISYAMLYFKLYSVILIVIVLLISYIILMCCLMEWMFWYPFFPQSTLKSLSALRGCIKNIESKLLLNTMGQILFKTKNINYFNKVVCLYFDEYLLYFVGQ